jgi:hypothetical protein
MPCGFRLGALPDGGVNDCSDFFSERELGQARFDHDQEPLTAACGRFLVKSSAQLGRGHSARNSAGLVCGSTE